jgi:dihydroorotase
MSPPLRTQQDVDAIIEGLKDGTIDAIATDHAPHTIEEKEVEFIAAPFGIIGLETALGLTISQLVEHHGMSLTDVFSKLSINPYNILGLPVPEIAEGELANLTIFDANNEWTVDKNKFKSRSRNSPFHDKKLKGKPWGVINNKLFNKIGDS